MNISELTFGIEFETTIPVALANIVGSYRNGREVEWLPAGWKAKSDCSIRTRGQRVGCEFVSPVLSGADGIAQVLQVVRMLNEKGAKVNASTGLHIHVAGFSMDDQTIKRLTTLVANFEKAIYASTGTRSRERGTWCNGVQSLGNFDNVNATRGARYRVLNLSNITNPCKPSTVEFRAFAGTLNETKVLGYLRLCLGLVERAVKAKRTTNWTAKTPKESSPIARKGAGQTALTRLFYQLGWTRGRVNHLHGDLTCENAPSHKQVKRELMRLAKKYDSQV